MFQKISQTLLVVVVLFNACYRPQVKSADAVFYFKLHAIL